MKLVIFHLKHLIRHLPDHIGWLYSRTMLSIPVHVLSIRWIGGGCFVIVGQREEGKLQIGSQVLSIHSLGPHHRPLPSVGWFDQPKLLSHSQIDYKRGQGFSMAEVQQLSFRDSMQI